MLSEFGLMDLWPVDMITIKELIEICHNNSKMLTLDLISYITCSSSLWFNS